MVSLQSALYQRIGIPERAYRKQKNAYGALPKPLSIGPRNEVYQDFVKLMDTAGGAYPGA